MVSDGLSIFMVYMTMGMPNVIRITVFVLLIRKQRQDIHTWHSSEYKTCWCHSKTASDKMRVTNNATETITEQDKMRPQMLPCS